MRHILGLRERLVNGSILLQRTMERKGKEKRASLRRPSLLIA